jgi:hypothetical protein
MLERTEVPAEFRGATGPTATEPQLNYLRKLRDGKDLSPLDPKQIAWLQDTDFDTFPSQLPKQRMSEVIEKLVELDWVKSGSKGSVKSDVPDGRYAVEKDDGTLMFYSVKAGHSRIFVDVWASEDPEGHQGRSGCRPALRTGDWPLLRLRSHSHGRDEPRTGHRSGLPG